MPAYLVNDAYTPTKAEIIEALNSVMSECEGRSHMFPQAWPTIPVRYEHAGNGLSGHIYVNTYHDMSQKEPTNTWCVHYNTREYGVPKVVF